MNRRGSLGPIGGFMRGFGAPLRIVLPVWAVPAWVPTRRAARLRSLLLIACAGFVVSITGCLPALAATRHVVLLYDERVELPGLSLLDTELVNTLRSNSTDPIEIYREAMDLSRFGSDAYKALLRDFLSTKYVDKRIDVAVAVMAPAFDFLSPYGDLIFPGAQIMFCGLDRVQLGTRPCHPTCMVFL
jgi:hypothetical protein